MGSATIEYIHTQAQSKVVQAHGRMVRGARRLRVWPEVREREKREYEGGMSRTFMTNVDMRYTIYTPLAHAKYARSASRYSVDVGILSKM